MNQLAPQGQSSEFLLYTTPNGDVRVEVLLKDENIRMPQKKMAALFGVNVPAISKHIKNIFEEGELEEKSVISILETTADDEKNYQTTFYNLDAIIAVGYRVNSKQATQFRIRANKILKEYIIKGFAMDDERLKNPNPVFGQDYFDEQLQRIRDIRSSERRFYQKITDIYAQCSIDYDASSEITKLFFATVQNKLHFATTGQTAAEIIQGRADHKKQKMGLKTRKNAPGGAVRKTDVAIAKNYLNEEELDILNRIVTMYLDYAELQSKNKIAMKMEDRVGKLNVFLEFNEKDILDDAGKVESEVAKSFAEGEFEKYNSIQLENHESDFDKLVENLEKK